MNPCTELPEDKALFVEPPNDHTGHGILRNLIHVMESFRRSGEKHYCSDTAQSGLRDDITHLAPYLNGAGIHHVIGKTRLQETGFRSIFYGPPLLVRGAFHVYQLRLQDNRFTLGWLGAGRAPQSYVNEPHEDPSVRFQIPTHLLYRINDFSCVAYGDNLRVDDWWDVVRYVFAEPLRRDRHHDLRPLATVTAALSRSFEAILGSRLNSPLLSQVEASISAQTCNAFGEMELIGGRPTKVFNQCVRCSGGLMDDRCEYCQTRVIARMANREVNALPAPPRIAAALPSNFFQIHPERAVKAYYYCWSREGANSVVNYPPPRLQAAPKLQQQEPAYDRIIALDAGETKGC